MLQRYVYSTYFLRFYLIFLEYRFCYALYLIMFHPFAIRKAKIVYKPKIVYNFGLFECNIVKALVMSLMVSFGAIPFPTRCLL